MTGAWFVTGDGHRDYAVLRDECGISLDVGAGTEKGAEVLKHLCGLRNALNAQTYVPTLELDDPALERVLVENTQKTGAFRAGVVDQVLRYCSVTHSLSSLGMDVHTTTSNPFEETYVVRSNGKEIVRIVFGR